ncbi:hypothetical protein ACHWQZ_G015958 [Mnemiopsis leidyi]
MLLALSLLICAVRAGKYRVSTQTTPWMFKLITTPQTFEWWFPSAFFEKYELGPPDKSGARPLLVNKPGEVEDRLGLQRMRPICDDYWMDLEAENFCKMHGYKRGRRASLTAEDSYAETQLFCFDFTAISITQLSATERCTVTNYEDTDMACTSDQAAGVYCYNEIWIPKKVIILSVKNTMKKFKIVLLAGSEKYGRFYNANDHMDTLDTPPTKSDFKFVEQGSKKSVKLTVKFKKKGKEVILSGKFPQARTCYEIYYKEVLFMRCMQSGVIKIKDFRLADMEDGVLKEKFVLESNQGRFQDGLP